MQCTLTGLIFFEKMAHRQYRSAAESVAGNRRTQCASEGKLQGGFRVSLGTHTQKAAPKVIAERNVINLIACLFPTN